MLSLYITYRVYKGYWEYRAYCNNGAGFSGSRYREILAERNPICPISPIWGSSKAAQTMAVCTPDYCAQAIYSGCPEVAIRDYQFPTH